MNKANDRGIRDELNFEHAALLSLLATYLPGGLVENDASVS
jgi:hypothetical protein